MKNRILFLLGKIFGRKKYYFFGLILQHIAHRMMGIGNYENDQLSGESNVIDYITSIYNGNGRFIFIDIGAGHSSEHTQKLLKYFPNLRGYLFEPMPKTFKLLKNKFARNQSIKIFNFAIGEINGDVKMFDYKGKQTEHASMHKEVLSASGKKISSVSIKIKSLKSITKENNLNHINFLKIDTEGYEFEILNGFKNNLISIDFIQFEFNSMNIFSKVRFKDFYDLLSPSFKIYRIYQDGLLEIHKYEPIYQEIYEFQNYLAENKKYAK